MSNMERWSDKFNEYTAPVFMLMMLSVSVLICTIIVLAEPYRLFLDKKGNEALELVVATAKWMVGYLILFFGALLIW